MVLQARYDVAISGGGFVGVSLALALAKLNLDILLIEKGEVEAQLAPEFDGRVCAIALGSKRTLESIGAWDTIAPQAEPILDIRVSDADTPFFLHYDHNEIQKTTGGAPFGYIAENRYIKHGLYEAAGTHSNLHIVEQTQIKNFHADPNAVTITTHKGDEYTASLLVGADGKNSTVRSLAGIKDIRCGYKQTAIVCTIAHEKPHEGLAQERFLPAGPFAVLPMMGNRSSLVWVEPDDRVQLYLDLPEDDFIQEITERVGGYLGKITVEGGRFSYPLSLIHAKEYIKERVALIGDAAHGMHPIAGQGVNYGFRDVAVLAELIEKQHTLGLDIGDSSVLEHYQRWRRFDNVSMITTTDAINRLFSNNLLPFKLARGLGLWAAGQSKPLKRFFMLHAMGLAGDVPAMAKRHTQ